MAKGDKDKMQNQVDYQGGYAQNNLDNLRNNMLRQNQGLENRFNVAADQGNTDYSNLMGLAGGLLGNITGGGGANFGAYGGYQDFANTGGYSDQDISNLRARYVAPMRAVYANAMHDVDRQKALQGGYSPNAVAAKAKMARELSYGLADASTNAEASIADAIRQGKLSGLGGMTTIDNARMNNDTQRAGLANSLFGQMGNLYSSTPGMASMYGNQLGNSNSNQLQVGGLQNDIMRNYLSGQQQANATPSNFDQALGRVKGVASIVSDFANPIGGVMDHFGYGKGSSGMGNKGYTPNDTNGWG